MSEPESRRKQIRNRVINTSLGSFMRAIDLVLDYYTETGGTVEQEAKRVQKLSIVLMAGHFLGEEKVVLLDTDFQLPAALESTATHNIKAFLKPEDEEPLTLDEGD